ncbi:MAG: adenosine deaminase, partial [Firmicutes bacterium]|nr:adenosine deaminase [Bacillota bacterium]
MIYFGRFYLDKEKDMIVDLYQDETDAEAPLSYVLSTPNHNTGNLITNLASLCELPLSRDDQGLKVIRGTIPCYYDAYNRKLYIFRLGGTKTANIYPDGRIEMKASIPAISKTLMSQTKEYKLDIARTLIKTYIRSDTKFRTDLHTHMNANLPPDVLIALGIAHQIRYPLYYIKKLELMCTEAQWQRLMEQRTLVEQDFSDSTLTGKYLTRRIDDHTFIDFADLILNAPEYAAYNISRIRTSLAVLKDGQAVFTNLEKVYLYRYVFTKGAPSEDPIELKDIEKIPDEDIRRIVSQILSDRQTEEYRENTLFQDKLLWIARNYQQRGIRYAEISDTTLVKKEGAWQMLAQVHAVMPAIYRETGVRIRFLAAIRRIPLTIIKDSVTPNDYLLENLHVLEAVAPDPYVAGSDIVGEEINDIRELGSLIREIVRIAGQNPGFVVRIHAGENDSLR